MNKNFSLLDLAAITTCICIVLTPMLTDNKYFFILWIAYIIDIVLALCVIVSSDHTIRLLSECKIYIVFIIYSFLSTSWAIYNKNMSIRLVVLMFLFMMISIEIIDRAKCYIMLLRTYVLAGVATSLFVLFQSGLSTFITSLMAGKRFGGDVAQLNSLGAITAIAATVAVALYILSKNIFYIVAFAINVLVLFGCESRMSLLMLVLGCIFVLYSLIVKKENGGRYKFLKFIFLMIVLISLGWYIMTQLPIFNGIYQRVFSTLDFIKGKSSSAEGSKIRTELIRVGINEFLQHPIFGIGYNNARFASEKYLGIELYTHNNYVEILANSGIIGFGIFYSMYVSIFYKLKKKNANESVILKITIILMFLVCVEGLFGVTYFSKYFYCLMILVISVANSDEEELEDEYNEISVQ